MSKVFAEIPDELKEQLRIYCARNNKKQNEVIIYALRTLIGDSRAQPIFETITKKVREI